MVRSKRILYVIASQHLKVAGGIGQFLRGLQDFREELDCHIDVCMDKAPNQSQKEFVDCNFIYPDTSLPYTNHRNFFAFHDSINAELVVNFRNAISKALRENLYTHIILNTPEANIAAQYMGLDGIKVITYSHQESYTLPEPECYKSPTFSKEYLRIIRNLDGLGIGCQSQRIADYIKEFSPDTETYVLPFFFPKDEEPTINPSGEGLMFVGRWEDRKNPKLFVEMIKKTGLHAKVLTNATGHKKFESALSAIGASYEIKSDITGKEKSDFMSSAKVAFCPNKVETGPYSAFESMLRMKTIIPQDAAWSANFEGYDVYRVDMKSKTLDKTVLDIYNSTDVYTPPTLDELNQNAIRYWKPFLEVDRLDSIKNYKNGIMETISCGDVFTPDKLIDAKVFNQTSVNQLLKVLKMSDVNVGFTDTSTIISTGPLVTQINQTSTIDEWF